MPTPVEIQIGAAGALLFSCWCLGAPFSPLCLIRNRENGKTMETTMFCSVGGGGVNIGMIVGVYWDWEVISCVSYRRSTNKFWEFSAVM